MTSFLLFHFHYYSHLFFFCISSNHKLQSKSDVDDIHEYLLLKGVEAVAIHGSKDQEERDNAIHRFKSFQADVLVATYLLILLLLIYFDIFVCCISKYLYISLMFILEMWHRRGLTFQTCSTW